jgi:radical SAM protein with 4Fe4S-binding SPASM domain
MNNHPRDLMRLASAFTPRRAINAARVLANYQASRITGKVVAPPFPISLAIEPTTSCNLRCPECPSGLRSFTRPTGMLDPAFFRSVIDQVHRDLAYLVFYFQGEPFLHPHFTDLVRYAKSKNIYTATSTNAHYLTADKARETVASGLDRLIISIDGTTQETYSQYRVGGDLEKVLEGTRHVLEARKVLKSVTPYTVFQFLVVRPNEHQVEDVRKLASKLGVDRVVFKTAQVYDFENGHPLIPEHPKYARYRKTASGRWEIRNPLDNRCWKLWHSAVVTWDGRVVPCCFDKDAQHVMGHLDRQSFREIWNGPAYRNFRAQLLHGRKEIDICRNCSEGLSVFRD